MADDTNPIEATDIEEWKKSCDWLDNHYDELLNIHRGEYVVIHIDRVICSGTFDDVATYLDERDGLTHRVRAMFVPEYSLSRHVAPMV